MKRSTNMNTISEIEDAMADIILDPQYQNTLIEYERLLSIMGNVDGNEVIALSLLAYKHTHET